MLTRRRRKLGALLVLIMALAFTTGHAGAQSGKQDYETYCAECHGSHGKGNGPSLKTIPMNPPPSDLTQLAKKNGGKFPFDEVVDTIDGRKNIPSHERLQMPFLGLHFRSRARSSRPKAMLR